VSWHEPSPGHGRQLESKANVVTHKSDLHPNKELGPDSLDKQQPQRLTYHLVKRLESLGHAVTLTPMPRAA
jgi:hypothetical protein